MKTGRVKRTWIGSLRSPVAARRPFFGPAVRVPGTVLLGREEGRPVDFWMTPAEAESLAEQLCKAAAEAKALG